MNVSLKWKICLLLKLCTSQIQDPSAILCPNKQEYKKRPIDHWFLARCFWELTCPSITEPFLISNFDSFYHLFKFLSFPDSFYHYRLWKKDVMLAFTRGLMTALSRIFIFWHSYQTGTWGFCFFVVPLFFQTWIKLLKSVLHKIQCRAPKGGKISHIAKTK